MGKMFTDWLVKHKRWGVVFWLAIALVGLCLTSIKVLPSQVSLTKVKVVPNAQIDKTYSLVSYEMKSKNPFFLPSSTTTITMEGSTVVITPRWKFAPYAPLTNLAQNENHKQVNAVVKMTEKQKNSQLKVVVNTNKPQNEISAEIIK